MNKRKFSKGGLMLVLSIILSVGLQAQTLKLNPKSFSMTIYGTTNVHNFESKVTQASGEIAFVNKKVQSMFVNIPVRAIKSNEKLMDTKTYETFKSDKNPMISFRLTEVSTMNISGNAVNAVVEGNMTMGGVTKKVSLKANGKNIKPGVYEFSGVIALKMSDFGMKPPTAMLGMMRVGDGITIKYNATFEGADIN
jgi:polyisoprenoid-binding protein YceI